MSPQEYMPIYLEHLYLTEHPELTDMARELLREQVLASPERYATTPPARAVVAYAQAHAELSEGLFRTEGLPDGDFEQVRTEIFDRARAQMGDVLALDPHNVDAALLSIQLSEVPLEGCLGNMMQLERETRGRLAMLYPEFDPDDAGLLAPGVAHRDEERTAMAADPQVIGWLHVNEALAQGCIFTARYSAAAAFARTVMRAEIYPSYAVGTLLIALARLEDEDAFFEAACEAGEEVEEIPWYLLGRTVLLYKLGQRRNARRALRDFVSRCDGGAFFLLNPTFHDPYLPVRPQAREAWDLTHQAVWEADGILADTPDFPAWAEGVPGVREASDSFAAQHGL